MIRRQGMDLHGTASGPSVVSKLKDLECWMTAHSENTPSLPGNAAASQLLDVGVSENQLLDPESPPLTPPVE